VFEDRSDLQMEFVMCRCKSGVLYSNCSSVSFSFHDQNDFASDLQSKKILENFHSYENINVSSIIGQAETVYALRSRPGTIQRMNSAEWSFRGHPAIRSQYTTAPCRTIKPQQYLIALLKLGEADPTASSLWLQIAGWAMAREWAKVA
jgi:hypothetical protein